ncbi:MAG: AMP-binding protein, partial [Acidimicrobiales bacterium]
PALRTEALEISYKELEQRTNQVGHALANRGAQKGNVCFIGKNVPEFWIAWLGTGKAGAAFVPLNWRCAAPELAELIDDAAPSVILTQREYAGMVEKALAESTATPEVIVFDSRAEGGAGLTEWCGQEPTADPGVPVTGEDIALIAYTSGTTGRPKGVMIRHEAFDLFHLSDDLEPTINWSADDVNLMVMPNFHLAGSWVSLPALYHGGTVATLPAFEPNGVLDAIERCRPTTLCLVPTAIQALLAAARTTSADLSSLRTLIYAGSPIPASTIEQAITTLGCELRQFYGATETYIITILRPDDHHPGDIDVRASCGAPVPLVAVRIVDPTGADLPDGEVGQVLVRSPMVMAGYFHQPEETARVLRDGWYWTGDLGYRTPSGHHFLVDRAKDMVVTGGENVYSVEVERALQKHPSVAMVAVVGIPDERWGEAVTAYVVPQAGASDTGLADDLGRHCRELIAAYKVPKDIHIVESLPMTPMGKVRKVDLRARNEQRS